jgi:catechol 2,3-dioxygenase-like lactoylglutathione lyase family enzyme
MAAPSGAISVVSGRGLATMTYFSLGPSDEIAFIGVASQQFFDIVFRHNGNCDSVLKNERLETPPVKVKIMSKVSVRYIVNDVGGPILFYTDVLGLKVDLHPAPGFASLSRGDLQLLLNRPGAGGAGQAMPDNRIPAPGGWNRIQIEVENLEATAENLKAQGVRFRNAIVTGNGGKQVLIEDPSGNPVELFQPF